MDTYQDYKLHNRFKRKLQQSKFDYDLRTLSNCGSIPRNDSGVHILSNGKQTKVIGTRFCANSWGCPACTARKMAKYSSKVSSAIDALAQQNKAAIMITFTVFHTNQHYLNQVLTLLNETWKNFNRNSGWKRKKKNSNDEFYTSSGAYQKFKETFSIQHTIKATEITYGEHGWHPHLHVLHFINKSDLPKIAEWEEKLIEQWQSFEKKAAEKIFTEKMFQVRSFLQQKSELESAHHGVYISKGEDNQAIQIKSGDYICGWGGNNELTGGSNNLKTANEGHMTLIQMLTKALETNDDKLFETYCLAMKTLIRRKQHKIEFSRTGLKAIITQYRNTEGYKETLKKKRMESLSQNNIAPFQMVAWFSSRQWLNISILEKYQHKSIIPMIIKLAIKPNNYELICKLMKHYNLDPPLKKCPGIDITDSFNKLCGFAA